MPTAIVTWLYSLAPLVTLGSRFMSHVQVGRFLTASVSVIGARDTAMRVCVVRVKMAQVEDVIAKEGTTGAAFVSSGAGYLTMGKSLSYAVGASTVRETSFSLTRRALRTVSHSSW
jgi:hypothetical protein